MNNEYFIEYNCCKHLYSSLVLDFNGLKFCNEVANSIEPMPYSSLDDLEKYENKRLEIIEKFKNGDIPEKCTNCSLLYSSYWDLEYQDIIELNKLTIFNWNHCNSKCFYCSVNAQFDKNVKKSESYDALPVVEKLIADGRLTENSYVDFQGGEPTMLEEFPVILKLLLEKNCKLQVLTNAIKYEPLISEMIRNGTSENCMCVSLDCGTSSTYKKIKRVNKFEQVVSNISRYIEETGEKSSNIRIKYIILSDVNDNKKEIDSFIDICKKMNVKLVSRTCDHRHHINKKENLSADCRLVLSYDYLTKKCKQNNINIYEEYWADEHFADLKQKIKKKARVLYLLEKIKFYFK